MLKMFLLIASMIMLTIVIIGRDKVHKVGHHE